MVYCGRLTIS
ncbi:unnamed protein product [Lathyrus oleraceus]